MKTLLAIFACCTALCAQDWIPKRIVGITTYPSEAKRQRIQGKVQIRCFLHDDGSVSKTELLLGHPVFTEQALANAAQWTFQRWPNSKQSVFNEVILNYEYVLEAGPARSPDVQFIFETPNQITVKATIQWPPEPDINGRGK